jgi:Sec34-like family
MSMSIGFVATHFRLCCFCALAWLRERMAQTFHSASKLRAQQAAAPARAPVQMAAIKKSCERLMHEKEMLAQYGSALTARLACFDELEELTNTFNALAAAPAATGALELLNRLDDCLGYMASNPQYADTMAYSLRLRQLQVRQKVAAHVRISFVCMASNPPSTQNRWRTRCGCGSHIRGGSPYCLVPCVLWVLRPLKHGAVCKWASRLFRSHSI